MSLYAVVKCERDNPHRKEFSFKLSRTPTDYSFPIADHGVQAEVLAELEEGELGDTTLKRNNTSWHPRQHYPIKQKGLSGYGLAGRLELFAVRYMIDHSKEEGTILIDNETSLRRAQLEGDALRQGYGIEVGKVYTLAEYASLLEKKLALKLNPSHIQIDLVSDVNWSNVWFYARFGISPASLSFPLFDHLTDEERTQFKNGWVSNAKIQFKIDEDTKALFQGNYYPLGYLMKSIETLLPQGKGLGSRIELLTLVEMLKHYDVNKEFCFAESIDKRRRDRLDKDDIDRMAKFTLGSYTATVLRLINLKRAKHNLPALEVAL